jgi:hypothetical protein
MNATKNQRNCDFLRSSKQLRVVLSAGLMLGGLIASGATLRSAEPVTVDQGPNWPPAAAADFYTRDQGSQVIKYTWLKALKRPDGPAFLLDQLTRYGYLANPGNPDGLPVGFVKASDYVGMSCAACHTRQISVDGKEYRIDGGPALVDAQSFFADLGRAVGDVLSSDAKFLDFAKEVIGQANPDPNDLKGLREEVKFWFDRYDGLMSLALPKPAWGPGRLDAVSMIFNRVAGLGIGPDPERIIAGNIKPADAPVRYPFLWNASRQNRTQWPGFALNGNDVLGLSRNVGEVFGVFASFAPKKEWWHPLGVNYLSNNSANFDGLERLENLIKKIGPPKYPWPIDAELAEKGRKIYNSQDYCAKCHGIATTLLGTWKTAVEDVGTDSREYDVLKRVAVTGVLEGKGVPFIVPNLGQVDKAFNILKLSVLGTIIQHSVPLLSVDVNNLADKALTDVQPQSFELLENTRSNFKLPNKLESLQDAFTDVSSQLSRINIEGAGAGPYGYEARVLQGIWAAAPYLHNGSVPTLAALLETRAKRPGSFKIGPNYDIKNLGLAEDQSKFGNQTLVTSSDRDSGSYNGGHEGPEYGTELKPEEKAALLEYLKTL